MRGRDKMAKTALWRGVLGVAIAALVLLLPEIGLLTLDSGTGLLAIGLLLYGLMGLYLGFRISTRAGRPWGSILNSILVIILGVVFAYGSIGDTDLIQILGGILIVFGVLLILYSFVRRSSDEGELMAADEAGTAVTEAAGTNVYQMRQKMVSIGDDYYIEDEQGNRVFKVDGKALRIRKTLVFEDLQGNELCTIKEQMFRLKDSMTIERDGQTIATIKKALIDPIHERYDIKLEDGSELTVKGNLVDHEYKIEKDSRKVAEVSKKWFRIKDTYGVEVAPGQNDIIILAASVALDQISHD